MHHPDLTSQNSLMHGEEVFSHTPKALALLKFLPENRCRTVKKEDEILENVRAGIYVEEGTPTRNVSQLRKNSPHTLKPK